MANGSFGLSGLPSAPTTNTVTTGGFTPVSTATTTLSSNVGFSAGDLIYLKNGDYGVPPTGSITSGGIAIYDTQSPVYSGTAGGNLRTPTGVNGGAWGASGSAKLTNGNTVFVYYDSSDSLPYFSINDASGNVVVSKTLISSSIYSTVLYIIGVVALTGGGFAVYYQDNQSGTNRVAYAIYTNGGGTVTAPTRDTTHTAAAALTRIISVALPNGGFALACRDSTNNLRIRFFSSTAALGAGWVVPSGFTAASGMDTTISMVARSDSSINVICVDGTAANSANVNTSNTTLGSARLTTGTVSWSYMTSVLLADNTVAVFGSSGGGGMSFYIVTGTTTPSWSLATSTGTSSVVYLFTRAYLTSSNNIVVWSYGDYAPQYEIFSTAGASLMGYPRQIWAACHLNTQSFPFPAFIESGTTINVYWAPATANQASQACPPITSFTFDSSTYALQSYAFTNGGLLATTSAVGLAGYNKTNSNPNGASFYASSSGTANATSNVTGTTIVGQTVIESATANAMYSVSTADGGCAIVYKLSSGNVIKLVLVSKAGVIQNSVTVGSGISTAYTARLAVLSDGKICVIYYNSTSSGSNIISYKIYSSTLGVLNSGVLAISGFTIESPTSNYTRCASIAALNNGDFVVMFPQDGAGAAFRVYTNTGAAASAEFTGVGPTATADVNFAVGGNASGDIYTSWKTSTTNWYTRWYKRTGSYTYAATVDTSLAGGSAAIANRTVVVCQDNGVALAIQGSSNAQIRKFSCTNGNMSSVTNLGTSSGGTMFNAGITGSGLMVACNSFASGTPFFWYLGNGTQSSILSLSAYSTDAALTIAGSYGNNAFICLLTALNAYPSFTLVTAGPITYPAAYTTSSFTAPISVSPSNGFYFTGVALTDCPPGGTGTVVVNGSAQLNSNYPSDTTYQAFDFRNPTLFGAKGTIGGRNVSLQGNI